MRVGHFEPEEICLTGEGVFPRITLDLPRDTENDRFKKLFETAKGNLSNVENIEEYESDVFVQDSEVNWEWVYFITALLFLVSTIRTDSQS